MCVCSLSNAINFYIFPSVLIGKNFEPILAVWQFDSSDLHKTNKEWIQDHRSHRSQPFHRLDAP